MLRSLGLALLLSALTASGAGAATLTPVGGTFADPIFITSDPDDSSQVLVVEREGRVVEVGEAGSSLYADLTDFVACCFSERGLLSIAPAPDFHESGIFYAAYTGNTAAGGVEGDIHVDAFVADEDAEVTRTTLLTVGHSGAPNHNGGQIQFGPDGYLYISTGDGGGAGDPFESGQSLSSLLGKVLRIDPEPESTPSYSIPPGNPFAGATAGADEIWAYGLRNPWRFSFDSLTGDMVIGDVGQGLREEVDLAASPSAGIVGGAGANYGWSCREGFIAYPDDGTPTLNCAGVSNFTDPVFDYPHIDPGGGAAHGCSITGGYVVRDPSLGDLYGRYIYADYCVGDIRSLGLPSGGTLAADRAEGLNVPNPTSFGEDSCGRLYVASGSSVYRFDGASPPDCSVPPEEEPPGGDPPAGGPPNAGPAPTQPLVLGPPSAEIRLNVRRRGPRLLVTVRVGPCASWQGRPVRLNRGGEPVGSKRLDGDCAVVFRVPAPRRATFRALVESDAGAVFRSTRLGV